MNMAERLSEYLVIVIAIIIVCFCFCFYDFVSDKSVPPQKPIPVRYNVSIIDSGVVVLKWDNATLLPSSDCSVKFSHMGTDYSLTGKVLVGTIK